MGKKGRKTKKKFKGFYESYLRLSFADILLIIITIADVILVYQGIG